MEQRRGGRRGGNFNRNANERGAHRGHNQQHHRHDRQQGQNFSNFESEDQSRQTAGLARGRGEQHAGGRWRGRSPSVGNTRPARNCGSHSESRGIRQGLIPQNIEGRESSGYFGRKNQEVYGSSHSVSSTQGSEVFKSQTAEKVRHRSHQKATGSQNMGRRSEVLFGDDYDDGDFRGLDSGWMRIPPADKNAIQEDNVSVYSTDSYSSAQNYGSNNVVSGTQSKQQGRQSVTPVSYDFPKIGIYWDIENCPVPKKSALHLVKRIRDTFCANTHTEDEFVVVCDTAHQKKELLDQLSTAQVDVQHMNATSKNASDDMLRRKINDFADRNHPPAKVLLITGDINFGPDIHKLNYKRHFRVVLLHNKHASEALLMHANQCILYETFCQELPGMQNPGAVTERIPATLQAYNLPQHISIKQLRGRLDKLFSHFGGKIVSISNPPQTALIKFAALSDARKAQPRIDGADVHGARISVRFVKDAPVETAKHNLIQTEAHAMKSSKEAKPSSDTPQEKEKKEPPIGNVCVVRFVISGTAGVKELRHKLQPNLPDLDDFCVLSSQNEQTCCLIKLPSLGKAKKTVKCLNSLKTLTVLSTEILKGDENCSNISSTIQPVADMPKQSDMQKLRDNFNKMRQAYFDRHEARTKELRDKLWELREQISSSESYDRDPKLEACEKTILSRLNVMIDVQKEFDAKTEKLVMFFLHNKSVDMSSNTSRLMAECHLFVSATPVYAVRSVIESKVSEENFVLVSSPPGTSKSTQVIQCLFHAEICMPDVTLACTQPHKELVVDHGAYVASQVKSAVGKQVAFFKIRKNSPGNQLARILYLPDHILLEEAIADHKLSNYGCIVLDEVQQRSLATELLLVYLHSLVKLRKGLKVVILSTPDRAPVLRKYLGRIQEVPLSVEPYPVDIIWRSNPAKTYVEACVKLAIQLHLAEDGGDILVFLASSAEVVQAKALLLKEMAKCTDVCIIQLVLSIHFKEMRKKLSQQTAARNIILTSNNLEDVITVPSVKYVVDAGLSTESSWEIGHEIIEVKYVSQSTAAMRANKAGMRTVGQCYRLYSPDQYTSSQRKGPQERELELMVLKLFLMDINPLNYNYIDAPDRSHLGSVLKHLCEIGAVNNNKLTSIGEKMASMTLAPHLSFFLLKAHEKNEGYAALVLCAIACVAKSFTLPKVDRIANGFPTGDLLSFIALFQTWFSHKPAERKKLVADNKIDDFILEVIQDKLMELHESLKNVDVHVKLVQTHHWPRTLAALLKEFWVNNLCALHHSHTRTYHCLKTNQYLILLPNCFDRGKPLPKYVVFEKLWKTPLGEFISNVFPIDEAMMQKGFEHDIPHSLQPNDTVVCPVGPHLMRSVVVGPAGEKLIYWERVLGEMATSSVVVKAFQSRGQVVLNAPTSTHPQVVAKLQNALESGRKLMLNERWECNVKNYPGIRIHWGQTAEALQLLIPSDFARVLVVVPESVPMNKILATLRTYGRTVHQNEKVTKHGRKQVVVMYETPKAASNAVKCKEYDVKPMANISDQSKPQLGVTCVNATWIRRKNLGTAVVQLKSGANVAVASVYFETERLPGSCLEGVLIVPEDDSNRIVIKRLPQHVSRLELEETVNHCLAKMPKDTVASVSLTQVQAFESSAHDVLSAKEQLQSLFSHYDQKLVIVVRQPDTKDEVWTATLTFEDESAGQVIIDDLTKEVSIKGDPVHFKLSYQCCVSCSSIIFDHIKNKYVSIVTKRQAELGSKKMAVRASTESLSDSGQTIVSLYGYDIFEVKRVHQELVKLLQDTIMVDISHCNLNDDLFYEDGPGRIFIDSLHQKYAASCILIALKKKRIVIYGKDALKIKQDIDEFIELESAKLLSLPPQEVLCTTVNGLIRELVIRYGLDLSRLKDAAKAYKLTLDVKAKTLVIHADSHAFRVIRAVMVEVKAKLAGQADERKRSNSTTEVCPICSDSISNTAAHYRMEYCGHAYCEPCMAAYLETTTPPVRCLYADCGGPLVFRDLTDWQRLQGLRYPGLLDRLADRATNLYIEHHASELHYCPLPSCEGIVKIESDRQLCTSCLNTVCPRCNVLYHFGDSCHEFQKGLKPTTPVSNTSMAKSSTTSAAEQILTRTQKLAELKEMVNAYRYKQYQTDASLSVTQPATTAVTSASLSVTQPATTAVTSASTLSTPSSHSASGCNELPSRPTGPPPLSPFRTLPTTLKNSEEKTSLTTRIKASPAATKSCEPPVSPCYVPSSLGSFPSTTPTPRSPPNLSINNSTTVLYPGRPTELQRSASSVVTRSATSPTVSYNVLSSRNSPTAQTPSSVYFPSTTASQAAQSTSTRSYPTTPTSTTSRPIAENRPQLAGRRSSTSQGGASTSKPQPKNECSVM